MNETTLKTIGGIAIGILLYAFVVKSFVDKIIP